MNGEGAKKARKPDQERDPLGRFSGPRLNVEEIPRLPTFPARWLLDDPRGRPYLVAWPSSTAPGSPAFALRLERESGSLHDVRLVFADGTTQTLEVSWRSAPAGGEVIVFVCPECRRGTRYLYFHTAAAFGPAPEPPALGQARCRRCLGLRWSTQGKRRDPLARAAARIVAEETGRARAPYPRRPWDPVAVSSPALLTQARLERAPRLVEPLVGPGAPTASASRRRTVEARLRRRRGDPRGQFAATTPERREVRKPSASTGRSPARSPRHPAPRP